ncbi:hypothetical protein A2U01_0118144, partial [Trifolium medium]|nr:hypothetical protein [Trifolium medium]
LKSYNDCALISGDYCFAGTRGPSDTVVLSSDNTCHNHR